MIINHILHRKGLYSANELHKMIIADGYIPVSSADELNSLRTTVVQVMGAGSSWENTYTTGVDKNYIQIEHIDLSSYQAGSGWLPIGGITVANYFTGIYDGNRLRIENLKIDTTDANYRYASIFGSANASTFRNIIVNKVNINYQSTTAGRVGSIVGITYSTSITTIENCSVHNATIKSRQSYTGGLVGYAYCSISNCQFFGNITGYNDSTSVYTSYVGGIAGISVALTNAKISNCVVSGNIYGLQYVGGILGNQGAIPIKNSVVIGTINATSTFSGGISGRIGNDFTTIDNSCFIGEMNSNGYAGGITSSTPNSTVVFIRNCYSSVTINANSQTYTGGIVGSNTSVIQKCYSNCIINNPGTTNGAVCGQNARTISNSYFNSDLYPTSSGGIAKTTIELKAGVPDATNFVTWDTTIWDFRTTDDYPILKSIKAKWQLV